MKSLYPVIHTIHFKKCLSNIIYKDHDMLPHEVAERKLNPHGPHANPIDPVSPSSATPTPQETSYKTRRDQTEPEMQHEHRWVFRHNNGGAIPVGERMAKIVNCKTPVLPMTLFAIMINPIFSGVAFADQQGVR